MNLEIFAYLPEMRRNPLILSSLLTAVVVALAGCGGSDSATTVVTKTVPAEDAAEPAAAADPNAIVVPDVVNYRLSSAEEMLKAAGISSVENNAVGNDAFVVNSYNWIVLAVSPKVGEVLTPGQTVTVDVVKIDDPKANGVPYKE